MNGLPDIAALPFACPPGRRSEVDGLLERFRSDLMDLLGDRLLALYVYGSLARGDFDPDRSDIDMLAVLNAPLADADGLKLTTLHDTLVSGRYRDWHDRIEVQYAHRDGLRTFRENPFRMANISPGEPFHFIRADAAWTCNWYFVQTGGLVLLERGVDRRSLTDPPVSDHTFVEAVRASALEWKKTAENARRSRGYQGYAILTLCRALYTVTTGKQVSKRAAADWVCAAYPEWASAVRAAWDWREGRGDPEDPEETWPLTRRIIGEMADRIETVPIGT